MKICNTCGGLKATENLEMIAGTICTCPVEPEVSLRDKLEETLKIAFGLWEIAHSPIGIQMDSMVEYKRRLDGLLKVVQQDKSN